MKKLSLLCVLASVIPATFTYAHDFWLEPGQYHYPAASTVPVQFKVGHNEGAENWALSWEKIVAIRNYTATGVADMAASIIPRSGLLPGIAKTGKLGEGSYVIGFESYHSMSSLGAEAFNRYAEEEGLLDIVAYRKSNGLMDTAGTELYSRKAKTIVQVGAMRSDVVTAPVGHTLEIVPLHHPANLAEAGRLPVQVLFRGEPLENALIDASPLADADHQSQSLTTDANGKATFVFPEAGPVKLNVVWGVPTQYSSEATFETYFSSLTFAIAHQP